MAEQYLLGLAWYLVGLLAFIRFWTRGSDLTVGVDLVLGLVAAVLGPLVIIIGWCFVNSGAVLVKQRPASVKPQETDRG